MKFSREWLSWTVVQVNHSVVFAFPSRVSKNSVPFAFFSYLVSCTFMISASYLTRNYIMFSWKVSDKYPKLVSSSTWHLKIYQCLTQCLVQNGCSFSVHFTLNSFASLTRPQNWWCSGDRTVVHHRLLLHLHNLSWTFPWGDLITQMAVFHYWEGLLDIFYYTKISYHKIYKNVSFIWPLVIYICRINELFI